LEPEVLVVDEVLAVGDAVFQSRCAEKMRSVAKEGRTVVLVSHNMGSVRELCKTAILLDGGQLVYSSTADDVVRRYQTQRLTRTGPASYRPMKHFSLTRFQVTSDYGPALQSMKSAAITIQFSPLGDMNNPDVYICITTVDGVRVLGVCAAGMAECGSVAARETVELKLELPSLPLMPGNYCIDVELKDIGGHCEFYPESFPLVVGESKVYGTTKHGSWNGSTATEVAATWEVAL
jgi:lipopolysaccharide transport system ATP-binding protein